MMFKINEADGLLSHVGTAWSGGADAAHFHVGEREVVVANVSSCAHAFFDASKAYLPRVEGDVY